uniref:Uncharacterized protein n=1 Tax=Arundo donax TaxID=35708 RepID=A0A0A9ECR0_ARUDO
MYCDIRPNRRYNLTNIATTTIISSFSSVLIFLLCAHLHV